MIATQTIDCGLRGGRWSGSGSTRTRRPQLTGSKLSSEVPGHSADSVTGFPDEGGDDTSVNLAESTTARNPVAASVLGALLGAQN